MQYITAFSVVPSLSIVNGLVALATALGTVWAWWRQSVIGSLSFETQIASSLAPTLGFKTTAEMMYGATGEQFGVVMITGLIVALLLGVLAKKPGMAWLNNFIMAGSMIVAMISALLWTAII